MKIKNVWIMSGLLGMAMFVTSFVQGADVAAITTGTTKLKSSAGTYFLQPKDVVLFFGDSITVMAKPEVDFLMADIKKKYPDLAEGEVQVRMFLSGSGGETARYGFERLQKALDMFHPTVCIVCYGMNDTGFNLDMKVWYEPYMTKIINMLKATNTAVVVMAPPPISVKKLVPGWAGDRFISAADRLPATAELARKVAEKEGVLFVDTLAAFKVAAANGNKEFTVDGVHPNADGFRIMADALQKAWGFGKPLAKDGSPRPQPTAVPTASHQNEMQK